MHSNRLGDSIRRLSISLVFIASLFSGLSVGNIQPAHAQGTGPCTILGDGTDSCEPDGSFAEATTITAGETQTHSISPLGDVDYVTFTLAVPSAITLETTGIDPQAGDTEMFLYNAAQQQIDYNDDKSSGTWWSYIQRCGPTSLPAGTYYAMVDKRGNNVAIPFYALTLMVNPDTTAAGCVPNTAVAIHGVTQGNYWVHQETTTRQAYAGVNSGPLQAFTLDASRGLIASIGVSLKKTAAYESYSEFVGVPSTRATTKYYFPWFSSGATSGLVSQLCFGNVGGANTTVTVNIGGVRRGAYGLGANRAQCVQYPGLNAGPVLVQGSGSVPIVASLNTRMKTNSAYTSYDEFGGVSINSSYANDFMFPWYNNTSGGTVSQLRFTNVGKSNTTVTILVHGVQQPATYALVPNQSKLISLANVNDGPVHVHSSNNVPISASMIVRLKSTASYTSYSEVMGLPAASPADSRVVFPWYSNAGAGNVTSQLRITNVGATTTTVSVTIGGTTMKSVRLSSRQSTLVSLLNVNKGPVVLQSSNSVPIVASMITYLKKGYGYTSYSEFAGQLTMPVSQLSVWFPWYGNASSGSLASQLRFGLLVSPAP